MTSSANSKLVVRCFSVSADGYGAGPGQDADNPLGVGGLGLHEWIMPTQTVQKDTVRKGYRHDRPGR